MQSKKLFFIPILALTLVSCGLEDLTIPVEEPLVNEQEEITEQSDSYDLLVKRSPYKIISLTFNGNDIPDIDTTRSIFDINTILDTYDIKVYRGTSNRPLPNIDDITIKDIGILDDKSGTIFSDGTPKELDYVLSNFGSNVEITFTQSNFTFVMYCNTVF